VCECPKGWTGSQCKTAICKPSCRNGGICTKPGVCSCPEGWEGYRCTIRKFFTKQCTGTPPPKNILKCRHPY
jgi:hypothetical protein